MSRQGCFSPATIQYRGFDRSSADKNPGKIRPHLVLRRLRNWSGRDTAAMAYYSTPVLEISGFPSPTGLEQKVAQARLPWRNSVISPIEPIKGAAEFRGLAWSAINQKERSLLCRAQNRLSG